MAIHSGSGKQEKFPALTVEEVENGFVVNCTNDERFQRAPRYVFNDAAALGKWITKHAGIRPKK